MRLFDKLNLEENGPMENTVDATGEIVAMNAHVSDWAKRYSLCPLGAEVVKKSPACAGILYYSLVFCCCIL